MITLLDYGAGNVRSVVNAIESLGETVKVVSHGKDILSAEKLIFPGVGAFGNMKHILNQKNYVAPLKAYLNSKRPYLGICLGLQLLFTESEEHGRHHGLDVIKGSVRKFSSAMKVPHMGWNELCIPPSNKEKGISRWKNTLLENTKEKTDVYFVHSYYPVPEMEEHIVATTIYGNQEYCAVVKKDNVSGTQFHPEKSSSVSP